MRRFLALGSCIALLGALALSPVAAAGSDGPPLTDRAGAVTTPHDVPSGVTPAGNGDLIPEATLVELARLDPDNVVILGGPAAVSARQADALAETVDTVDRLEGAGRFETAAALFDIFSEETTDTIDTVVVAPGRDFDGAVAAGPLAFKEPLPILLTESDALPGATQFALESLDTTDTVDVLIAGDTGDVTAAVVDSIDSFDGFTAQRMETDTVDTPTAEAVAAYVGEQDGFSSDTADRLVVRGADRFARGLAAAAYADSLDRPILLDAEGTAEGEVIDTGDDAFEAAAWLSEQVFVDTEDVGTVFVANASVPVDALAVTGLAGLLDAPILFVATDPGDPDPPPPGEPAPPPPLLSPPGDDVEPIAPDVPDGTAVTVAPGAGQVVAGGEVVQLDVLRPQNPGNVDSVDAFVSDFTAATGVGNRVRGGEDDDEPVVSGLLSDREDAERSALLPGSAIFSVRSGSRGILAAADAPSGAVRAPDGEGVPRVAAGGRLGLAVGGLAGDADGQVQLRSDPRVLAAFSTQADGVLTGEVVLPDDLAVGRHTLVITAGDTTMSLGLFVDERRIFGPNRFATAVEISTAEFTDPDEVSDVILAAGYDPQGVSVSPDALAASALAGQRDAPVLLVNNAAPGLPDVTFDELLRLDPDTVSVLGGPEAVPDVIMDELAEAGDWEIERLFGADRYATAAAVAEEVTAADDTVILASGTGLADALSAGPLAATGPHPILLTRRDTLPEVTVEALSDADDVVIVGGPAVVSEDVFAEVADLVGDEPLRLSGADRVATATEIATFLLEDVEGFTGDAVFFANGRTKVDALTGGGFAGRSGAPVLLSFSLEELGATAGWLNDNVDTLEGLTALGGERVIPPVLLDAAVAAATR